MFLYASRTYKIRRLITAGTSEERAITEVDTIDKDRAAFVKEPLKLNWPEPCLYHAMLNTATGDSYVAEMLLCWALRAASHEQISVMPNLR